MSEIKHFEKKVFITKTFQQMLTKSCQISIIHKLSSQTNALNKHHAMSLIKTFCGKIINIL